ncbi:EAL domain-containing protein [Phycisphaerales bacterium AB-hyl4]|uniref:EAL domain-containing protein n=1 Tax=Natronomicrosphaera hydrolytica TaxID=3242702 RepID=A0ABV4U544_9BACT
MVCQGKRSAHRCVCRQPVPELGVTGVVLCSQSPVVNLKLAEAFEPGPGGTFMVGESGWPERLGEFIETLSAIERRDLLASEVDEQGEANPWRAKPVEALLARVRSPWLPRLLNASAKGDDPATGLRAHFQPIVDTRRGTVYGFEALARATLDGETMPAGPIIDAARAHDAMFQFDQLARQAAIRQGWPQLLPGERLFINFAPTVIYDPAVCLQSTWEAAEAVGCDPTSLVFEVVESEQFPDMNHLKRILDAYRDLGAQVALDDLGSGHTALHYIDELHPDLIKLDRNLLPRDPGRANLSLLRGLVDYAHGQGIRVLAEGVETAAQYDMVREVGIEYAQGWYFAKPTPTMSRELEAVGVAGG